MKVFYGFGNGSKWVTEIETYLTNKCKNHGFDLTDNIDTSDEHIDDNIVRNIDNADLLVFNLCADERYLVKDGLDVIPTVNSNVMYELGVAKASEKYKHMLCIVDDSINIDKLPMFIRQMTSIRKCNSEEDFENHIDNLFMRDSLSHYNSISCTFLKDEVEKETKETITPVVVYSKKDKRLMIFYYTKGKKRKYTDYYYNFDNNLLKNKSKKYNQKYIDEIVII